jgi:1-acyl-sn-glycerol-3-phosphate acyltransferase
MIDEQHLRRLQLREHPLGQAIVASIFLMPNFNLPPRTRVVLEGLENIPSDRSVIFALNHTDRYNYWPFQYKMWRTPGLRSTTTWVKGKYYENKYLGWFFDQCNNIPLPSRGYLILQDAKAVLGRKLGDDEYRVLRDLVDGKLQQDEAGGLPGDVSRLLCEPRRDFQPADESYASFMHRWNDRLMGLVEQRTLEALFERHNHLIVFPQGTRSLRLLPGKSGLAQFALRHEIPVVPVGSMGSEEAYPGGSPWARGGATCRYRIGRPLSVDDAFADCRIHEPYTPFTRSAEAHGKSFELAMERVTAAIDALLEEPYKMATGEGDDSRPRADRLI